MYVCFDLFGTSLVVTIYIPHKSTLVHHNSVTEVHGPMKSCMQLLYVNMSTPLSLEFSVSIYFDNFDIFLVLTLIHTT